MLHPCCGAREIVRCLNHPFAQQVGLARFIPGDMAWYGVSENVRLVETADLVHRYLVHLFEELLSYHWLHVARPVHKVLPAPLHGLYDIIDWNTFHDGLRRKVRRKVVEVATA